MECNFACKYCYEGTLKGSYAMTDAVADRLIAFLKERFTPDKKTLRLELYGGEPLLYTNRIEYLSRKLKPFVEERGGSYELYLVTNGSLFTGKTASRLLSCGLKHTKITLDGPPENHNRFRPFKNGRPSFETIFANLHETCGMTDIGLAGNFTSGNYHVFPALLDLLEKAGLTPDKFSQVNFNIVMKTTDRFASPEYLGGCESINEPWLVEASLFLRQEVLKRGYPGPEIAISPCAVDVDDSFTVHYDGSLYKCLTLVGREEFKVGDIWSGIGDFSISHHLDHWKKNDECLACEYLPLCFGGCRYMEFQRSGNMATVDCQKPYLDATLEEMLTQDVRYRYKPA
jgi:uncharacterized protein